MRPFAILLLGALFASGEATMAKVPSVVFRPFVSDVMRGGQSARHIRVRVAGVEKLWLLATGVPHPLKCHAAWADAKLIDADGKATYVSSLKPSHVYQQYGQCRMDRPYRGNVIQIGKGKDIRRFRRGIGIHANSRICFDIGGKFEWFEAFIGIDVTAGSRGHVRFEVTDRSRGLAERTARLRDFPIAPLRRAIADLTATFGARYANGRRYLRRLDEFEASREPLLVALTRGDAVAAARVEKMWALRREALLANPLLDTGVLLVKRRPIRRGKPVSADRAIGWSLGFPRSSAGNAPLPRNAYDNEIAVLSDVRGGGRPTTLYRPNGNRFVGNVDLHSDAERMLFSMRDDRGRWQVHEVRTDPGAPGRLRQVSRGDQTDVDSYDACYLPDGRIVFGSSACFQSVPCNGSDVAVLYRMDADGGNVRQLCFEQDHDFNPTVMPDGRVLYLRWEYSDLPHANSRILFTMNPDGTAQREVYGSNSYWPNSLFGARAIPGQPGWFVGIVAGHHGSYREGELVVFDASRGRHEADGALQRIPGYGKPVKPIIANQLTAASWPKFVHPYPLRGGKYFLVTCKLTAASPWDLYLVDVFDNLLRLCHVDGYGLFEPIPLRKRPRPPVITDRTDTTRKDGMVYLMDVHRGRGLVGIPRGTVKALRVIGFHFAYQGRGGLLGTVGMDGPWDVRRVLGTVPVEPDGSAYFRVPANTPLAVQPLDADGKALQLMRSWFVAMPGEVLSCVGCHEPQSDAPPNLAVRRAIRREPSGIDPWPGPSGGFSYPREIQPVIDRHCLRCHDGKTAGAADLSGTKLTADFRSVAPGNSGGVGGRSFSVGYVELSRFVRRSGIESDMHVLAPMEYHADTTQLVQMLTKGHHGVRLDAESWRRLITWIDLNAPYHGTWTEAGTKPGAQPLRRRRLRKLYAGIDEDPEALAGSPPRPLPAARPAKRPPTRPHTKADKIIAANWPFDAGDVTKQTVDLGGGVKMDLVLLPAGEFVMGDLAGYPDERPRSRVRIDKPFWMGVCEVSNRQYARFDPSHDSRVESKNGYQFGVHGYPVNRPDQPVVRVSWRRAAAFCRWLSHKTARRFALPTEAQWEYACRAGTATAFSFGPPGADFSKHANLADKKLRELASDGYAVFKPLRNPTRYDDWVPRDDRFHDGGLITTPIGSYQPNPWGLRDMHGNVFEWTRTTYRRYPYRADDARDASAPKVVRGGSWRDRPKRCRSAFRLAYRPYQVVYNVGFRVICETQTFRPG